MSLSLKLSLLSGLALSLFLPTPALFAQVKDSQFFLDKANLYLREGKTETAIEYFKEALEQDPYNVQAYNNLGKAYAKKHMHDEALVQFDRLAKANPLF